jgi:hypothetical protein
MGRPLIHPRFRRLPPPVIVIGMHRCGTSPIAAMLQTLGVYMGPPAISHAAEAVARAPTPLHVVNGYAEAEEFRQLNECLLTRAGANWNHIDPFLRHRDRAGFVRSSMAILQAATFGSLRGRYLRALPMMIRRPWGWKDPRNSLTLPLWLRVFPEARIVHVRRDQEVAVASLHRRALAWQASPGPPLPLRQRVRVWAGHPIMTLRRAGRKFGLLTPGPADPCQDRDYCRFLYQQYVSECLRYREWGDQYLEVSYEEMVEAPTRVAEQLATFAACPASPARLMEAAALVRRDHRRSRAPEIARECDARECCDAPTT